MLQCMGLQRVRCYLVNKQLVSLHAAAGEDFVQVQAIQWWVPGNRGLPLPQFPPP